MDKGTSKMKLKTNKEGPPCQHMEALLQQVADGSIKGIKRYFALFHASHCYPCGSFLKRVQTMLSVVRDQKENVASEDTMARLRAQIKELDSSQK